MNISQKVENGHLKVENEHLKLENGHLKVENGHLKIRQHLRMIHYKKVIYIVVAV